MTAAKALGSTLKFKITVFSGKNPGKSFVFDKSLVTIGRDPENDLVFANDPRMSRSHLEIRFQAGKLSVKNISQKNHVLVNNERVEEKILEGPAFLQVGETSLQLQVEEAVKSVATKAPAANIPAPKPPAPPPTSGFNSIAQTSSSSPVSDSIPWTTPSSPGTQSTSKTSALTVVGSKAQQPVAKSQPASTPAAPRTPPPPPSMNSYQTPPAMPSSQSASSMSDLRPAKTASSGGGSRVRFYSTIVVVGLFFAWVLNDTSKTKKTEVNIRTEGDVSRAIEESARAVQEIQKKQNESGQDSIQYRAAQEHYIRGFRDYRQGQYARAMQSFSAALSFYPSHELARKYYVQAQRKFEAQIDFAMSQGRKYYQKNNFKMCQSAFANAMIMVKNASSPKYKEAKQFYDECRLHQEDRI